jgi:transposase InsO family protein
MSSARCGNHARIQKTSTGLAGRNYLILDNGVPFASAHVIYGLSKLSVWWLRLGIQIERIKPGHPQHNGRHERMHLTLKKDATKPASPNLLQQQARFDADGRGRRSAPAHFCRAEPR